MGNREHAVALFNQGVQTAQEKKYDNALSHAYKCFASACYADPTWWNAFYQSGNNNGDQNLTSAAIACFRRALECESKPEERAKILANLCWQLQAAGETDEAIHCGLEALTHDPKAAMAYLNLSICFRDIDDSASSMLYANKFLETD